MRVRRKPGQPDCCHYTKTFRSAVSGMLWVRCRIRYGAARWREHCSCACNFVIRLCGHRVHLRDNFYVGRYLFIFYFNSNESKDIKHCWEVGRWVGGNISWQYLLPNTSSPVPTHTYIVVNQKGSYRLKHISNNHSLNISLFHNKYWMGECWLEKLWLWVNLKQVICGGWGPNIE